MRPFFPFYGSKWNIARHYPAPRRDLVIEPFAGSAGYATFYGCRYVHLFEADPFVVGTWDYLLNAAPAEIMALPELPEPGDCVDNYAIPEEAKWLIGYWLNRGSASPKKTRTAYSARTDRAQLNWGERAKTRIAAQLPGIADWAITQGPYTFARNETATWFVDPPYGEKGRYYRVKFDEYASLATWCGARRGDVIACDGPGAAWLPFRPLGDFKTSKGRSIEMVHYTETP